MRKLIALDFPLTLSAEVTVPGESKIHRALKKRFTRTESAQRGQENTKRTDIEAEVAGQDITETLRAILAGRERLVEYSLTRVVRTSKPIRTDADRMQAQHELVRRRERLRAAVIATEGAQALAEREAFRRLYINSLAVMAGRNRRELECSSQEAANFLPLEGPWEGMSRAPLILFETPMRQLLGFSMFDASLSNYNMLMVAASGSGKSFLAQAFALMAARSNPMVCVIEAGTTYQALMDIMGGRTIHVSLDGEHAINPWDLPAGEKLPSNEKKAELKNLTLEMLRSTTRTDAAEADPAILESVLDTAIDEIYARFAESSEVPTYSELYSELEHWQDKLSEVKEQAKKAAVRLKPWVLNGTYAPPCAVIAWRSNLLLRRCWI
jgi:type IV secretory pathway VirB4 component